MRNIADICKKCNVNFQPIPMCIAGGCNIPLYALESIEYDRNLSDGITYDANILEEGRY